MPTLRVKSIIPREHYIVVQPDDFRRADSGIIIPESAQNAVMEPTGTVLAAGPGVRLMSGLYPEVPEFLVGDRVLVNAWKGTEIYIAGQRALVMARDYIIGKVELEPGNALTQ